MFDALSEAVGHRMPNRKEDVELVQRWLQTWDKYFWPGSPGISEGHLDGFTVMAIERFQREKMGQRMSSGVVEPGDATAKKLASTPGPRPEGRVLSLPIRTNFDPLSDKDYEEAAKDLKCEVRAIKAVALAESKRRPFDFGGKPSILFEQHLFNKYTQHKFSKSDPDITHENPLGKGSFSHQWVRLRAAYHLDSSAALRATSWGKFQILGNNFQAAGFCLLEMFIVAMCSSEKNQLDAFVAFVKADRNRLSGLQTKDWVKFAIHYNGGNYKKYNYDGLMKDAYDSLGK